MNKHLLTTTNCAKHLDTKIKKIIKTAAAFKELTRVRGQDVNKYNYPQTGCGCDTKERIDPPEDGARSTRGWGAGSVKDP